MKYVYLFDGDGSCISSTLTGDGGVAQQLAKLSGAANYCVSDDRVDVDRARWVDGQLADVEPVIDANQQWAFVREQREGLLLQSDWTDLLSSFDRLGEVKYSEWQIYRQALRDITKQADPFKITWPTPPT